jgi:hypothetical protein
MLDELDGLARTWNEQIYSEKSFVAYLQNELDSIAAESLDSRHYALHKALGRQKLRLGFNEEALENYRTAQRQLQSLRGVPPEEFVEINFRIGVTYLRLGETRNCVARHTPDSCILPIRGGGLHMDREPSTQAVRHLREVLARAPEGSEPHTRARWLLNIAHMTLDEYPDGVPEEYLIPEETFDSDEPFPRFVNIAASLGLDTFDTAGGAIGDDFDGDGFIDLVVSSIDTSGQMRYFRNAGDGTFVERTDEAGLIGFYGGLNMVHADYDNDGDTDVMVLRGAWFQINGRHPNSLLRNNGDGSFTDVTFDAGLGGNFYPTQTAAWADYDNDGDLDVYIGNEYSLPDADRWNVGRGRGKRPGMPAACELFRNNGDGTFTDVAAEAGVLNELYTKAVVWGDYDNDRDPDLYVSNLGDPNRLYRNNGDGTFTDVAGEAGVTRPLESFPSWFWDFDNDGNLDIISFAYGSVEKLFDVFQVAASYMGLPHGAELAALYRGDGEGGFEELGVEQNLVRVTLPMGSNFGDLDNDGYPDFYLGTGYPKYEGLMPNMMYRNRGGTGFSDVTTAGGFSHLQKGHGVVFADLDNDGDQDVFEQMGGTFPGDGFANAFYENPGFGNHWIKIRLVGRSSNRAGIGVRIRIVLPEAQGGRTIHHLVSGGGSFGGNPLQRREIGLGAAEKIERLEVFWPTTGETQVFLDVAADQLIEIVEDEDAYKPLPLTRVEF